MLNNPLDTPIECIKNVDPFILEYLRKKRNIYTYKDLISFYPIRYINRSKLWKISELNHFQKEVQIIGHIKKFEIINRKNNKRLIAYFYDETGVIDLIWFKKIEIIKNIIQLNIPVIIFGRINFFLNRIQIIHPNIENIKNITQYKYKLLPIYAINNNYKNILINNRMMIIFFQNFIKEINNIDIAENLPKDIIKKYKIISRKESLIYIHFPYSFKILFKAQYRIKFEEFFFSKLCLLLNNKKYYNGYRCLKIGKYFNNFYKNFLPFQLTNAQKNVIRAIRKDLGQSIQMNRIIQGDVGSGKTIVGLMSMLIVLDNGFQSCLMTPTELLAQQHYNTLKKLFGPMNIRFDILTGTTSKMQYKKICHGIKYGTISILIGTHSLIQEKIHFKNLGLVIIDEQHRFGVAQRAKFWKKNKNPPHILTMTATPIPRTLKMTLYGGLDISILDEYPYHRQSIKTIHIDESKRLKIFNFIKNEIDKGRQIFIVYPLINHCNRERYKDLMYGYNDIKNRYPEYKISILHGKMNSLDKDYEFQRFFNQETHIMISTTVIEVGIDIPNASIILIENADNFGLSQLHQLRGRVGRGIHQSYCILMTNDKISEDAKKRIQIMCCTNNGFKIAEEDLKLRGPGELMGTRQSGILNAKKLYYHDINIIKQAYEAAVELLIHDPNIASNKNKMINKNLQEYYSNKISWNQIS